MFLDYLLRNHNTDIENIVRGSDLNQHYTISVDFGKLLEDDPEHIDSILSSPVKTIDRCDADIVKAQKLLIDQKDFNKRRFLSIKQNVHSRFFGLPYCPDMHRIIFPKNKDLGCFLNISGTVVRLTQSKMLEYKRKYKCNKCQHVQIVIGDYEERYVIKPPAKCDNPVKCRATTFSPVSELERHNCKDYQELKLQEQVNKLSVGSIPGAMWVTLEDDLVDCCKPGDDVNICGVVRRRWRPIGLNKSLEVELVFHANYIEVSNNQKSNGVAAAPDVGKEFDKFWSRYEDCPLMGRDVILSAICPQVYGLYLVKLALLLTVITGSNHKLDKEEDHNTTFELNHKDDREMNESSIRGQCHLLLVGDPGTGKSQLLKAGATLSPRSVLTSGAGSTRAGLTCTALREEGEWQLEAGALVLSDGGICCIDEIGQMREHDRTSIHEAMEQQTISIAKAGIVCKLNTRVAVIAACNPKGNYETDQPLSVNVSLGTPLLSRFDLIFILLDSKNLNWDKLVSTYILFGEIPLERSSRDKWNIEKLQLYLTLIGPVRPTMSPIAKMILQAYYMSQRMRESRDPSRTTVRMLDSLVRLSQAHCRLMYRSTVLPVDAITAVTLMDLSMKDCTLPDTIDALHSTFTDAPDIEYLKTAKRLLQMLNLQSVWNEELKVYSQILKVDKGTLEKDLNVIKLQLPTFKTEANNDVSLENSSEITSTYFKKTENSFKQSFAGPSKSNKREKINGFKECNKNQNIKNTKLTFSQDISDDDLDAILSLDITNKSEILNKENHISNIENKIEGKTKTNGQNKSKAIKKNNFDKLVDLDHNKIPLVSKKDLQGKRKRQSAQQNGTPTKKCSRKREKLEGSCNNEEFNEAKALACLPSVNDFYKNLNISFDGLFEDSQEDDNKTMKIRQTNKPNLTKHDQTNDTLTESNKSSSKISQSIHVNGNLINNSEILTGKINSMKESFKFIPKEITSPQNIFKSSKNLVETESHLGILASEEIEIESLVIPQSVEFRAAKPASESSSEMTSPNSSLIKLQQFKYTKQSTSNESNHDNDKKDQTSDVSVMALDINSRCNTATSSQMSIFESSSDYDALDI